jgi:hypothetical protein
VAQPRVLQKVPLPHSHFQNQSGIGGKRRPRGWRCEILVQSTQKLRYEVPKVIPHHDCYSPTIKNLFPLIVWGGEGNLDNQESSFCDDNGLFQASRPHIWTCAQLNELLPSIYHRKSLTGRSRALKATGRENVDVEGGQKNCEKHGWLERHSAEWKVKR